MNYSLRKFDILINGVSISKKNVFKHFEMNTFLLEIEINNLQFLKVNWEEAYEFRIYDYVNQWVSYEQYSTLSGEMFKPVMQFPIFESEFDETDHTNCLNVGKYGGYLKISGIEILNFEFEVID